MRVLANRMARVGALAALFSTTALPAGAVEIQVQGEGHSQISADFAQVQLSARNAAIKKAVSMAVVKVLGADALDNPKVQQRFDDIVSQYNVYKVKQTENSRREGNDYVTSVVVILDDVKFRQTVSDLGVALNTAKVRSKAILTLMDEFFTTPSDLVNPAPLREVTVYKYDHDQSAMENDTLDAKSSSAQSSSRASSDIGATSVRASSTGSVQAKDESSASLKAKNKESGSYSANASGKIAGPDGSASASGSVGAKYAQQGSVDARQNQKSSLDSKHDDRLAVDSKRDKRSAAKSSSSQKESLEMGHFASASDSEHEFFTNIKEYQPKNGIPSDKSYTLESLQDAYQTYDIKVLANDRLRSQFFKGRAISIEQMEKSEELDQYMKFAKDAQADFFSIGSAIIVDRGTDPNTGKSVCDGMVAIKVYSTFDSEAIASGALTESSSGSGNDQCRVAVAKRIGSELGKVISNKIQEYWKKREMYGTEFTVLLTGDIPRAVRSQFTGALNGVAGITNVRQRRMEPGLVEFIISYNGQSPIGDAILDQMDKTPSIAAVFGGYEAAVDGTSVKLYPNTAKK